MAGILLIDDDIELRDFLKPSLEAHGHYVECLDRAERAPDRVACGHFNLMLLDNHLPGMKGLDFLRSLKQRGIGIPVILMTGDDTPENNMSAWNLGVIGYVPKPSGDYGNLLAELEPLIVEALENVRPPEPHVRLPDEPAAPDARPTLIGDGKPMREVYRQIGQYADSRAAVLILGETGTGKELVARAVHDYSARRGEFLAMNCTALTETLLEDELFGHVKGAFHGAWTDRKGRFEQADRGTLFMDEVGDMPRAMQEKLLRVLECGEVCRIGSSVPIKVDVRVVAATHRDLNAAVAGGRFREDLLHRLTGVTIRLPPLRERGTDLRLLTQHYLCAAARERGRAVPLLSADAWAKLEAHRWPGNVRELRNVLRRAVLKCRGPRIMPDDVEFLDVAEGAAAPAAAPVPEPQAPRTGVELIRAAARAAVDARQEGVAAFVTAVFQREMAAAAMQKTRGNKVQAAKLLGISRGALDRWLQSSSGSCTNSPAD